MGRPCNCRSAAPNHKSHLSIPHNNVTIFHGRNTMTQSSRSIRAAIVAVLAAGSMMTIGCTGPAMRSDSKLTSAFQKPKWLKAPWSKSEDEMPEPYPNPVKIASTWTPDVLVQTGKTPTRGFGGRLFFFDEKTKAVPVEGTLTVHGFELDSAGRETQIKPFKFTPEQFTSHFSQSDFGASYSIWIPWDAVGGDEKRVSLVPTFQTSEGKLVQGSPTTIILPGRKEIQPQEVASRLSPQYHGHRDALANHVTRPSGLVTTTIRRYGTTPEAGSTLPSPSLKDRVNAIVATHRQASAEGSTRFVDVPTTKQSIAKSAPQSQTPSVMPASAVMSTERDTQVRSAGSEVSAPRRIPSPLGGYAPQSR